MEMARGFGEEARVTEGGLKGRLRVVEGKVKGAVGGGEEERVANCSSSDSVWKLNQGGHHHLSFQWRCVIYQSMAEELSVWGSPLQTSGILAAGVSARSLTLLSGRIIEWSGGGKLVPTSRSSNGSSWTLDRWSSTAVQLEGETWVLEYQRSALFQGSGLIQSAWEISRLRTQRMARGLRWRLALARTTFGGGGGGGGSSSSYYRASEGIQPHFKQPT
ncbi:uncharacterized protein A4U43_C03F32300 [Asparagus officinalis]|uniref:Uncharacterized protein n=1 Tax=Asparagus officinalis TaxID=4686 RepID=A0A5P1FJP2_ASPOF|nr:uncharacterized protein LOC109835795 [Asparagus officinalis]ONK76800.1 uncharacterized protein A4U43_C03F32300 [Asparagus officinalis]